ncbi:MAG: bifunctional phosphopantothenoylcysteine decarboxylase/phosphopantothenate--cysteine ligase CoaBC [Eubacterium sp.]|nr:bifunctional phosphopantothenoylcysteine decarboxylase/phosphopantothenate--cysteine ligase CoaBC [Eubacterium sp.]HBE09956.1 bifunctional phosphopantothenoylcysteine decarboxylase/phosphopantothenate--cysteine ligase CoaBC [Lachnospiraceae bacterium]
MIKGKKIILGISGGIAAYKMTNVASMLYKLGADVHVIMTKNACQFITPKTFEVLTKNKVYVDTFDETPDDAVNVPHISLGQTADCFLIAPATANIIAKLAHGIADDMLTTTVLPARCPMLICPSMNGYMLENQVVQENIEILAKRGYKIIESEYGNLACGYEGKGKLPKEEILVEHILNAVEYDHDMVGKKVMISAGPTEESLDPVRILTNHSSGKMGFALARVAAKRGADVTLVTGPVNLSTPLGVERVDIVSAEDMYNEITSRAPEKDIIIMAAAIADYTPVSVADNKIKKQDGDMSIPLKRTKDVLKGLGENKKEGQFICGFSMETENMLENSKAKLVKKNADMICANNLKVPGAGYKVDTNIITIIKKDSVRELPIMSKDEAAYEILSEIIG